LIIQKYEVGVRKDDVSLREYEVKSKMYDVLQPSNINLPPRRKPIHRNSKFVIQNS
jgi:hypothetical protein